MEWDDEMLCVIETVFLSTASILAMLVNYRFDHLDINPHIGHDPPHLIFNRYLMELCILLPHGHQQLSPGTASLLSPLLHLVSSSITQINPVSSSFKLHLLSTALPFVFSSISFTQATLGPVWSATLAAPSHLPLCLTHYAAAGGISKFTPGLPYLPEWHPIPSVHACWA